MSRICKSHPPAQGKIQEDNYPNLHQAGGSCQILACLLDGAIVFGLQNGIRDTGINLRGARAAMSEQVLKRGERHIRLCHAPAKGMTKLMACDLNARFTAISLQDKLDAVDGESFAAQRNENRPIILDRAAGEPIVECR